MPIRTLGLPGVGLRSLSPRARGGGGAAPFVGPLDAYASDLAAAYSLRTLLSSWADSDGRLVRVRAFDGANSQGEADCLGVGDALALSLESPLVNLDATALGRGLTEAHTLGDLVDAGGGNYDGLVPMWYEQSGNARDATQASAAAQPRVVSAGALDVDGGGRPTITWAVTHLDIAGLTMDPAAASWTLFAVLRITGDGNGAVFAQQNGTGVGRTILWYSKSAGKIATFLGGSDSFAASAYVLGTRVLYAQTWDGGTIRWYRNGQADGEDALTAEASDGAWRIGDNRIANSPLAGDTPELLVYAAVTPDRAAIEAAINDHYALW